MTQTNLYFHSRRRTIVASWIINEISRLGFREEVDGKGTRHRLLETRFSCHNRWALGVLRLSQNECKGGSEWTTRQGSQARDSTSRTRSGERREGDKRKRDNRDKRRWRLGRSEKKEEVYEPGVPGSLAGTRVGSVERSPGVAQLFAWLQLGHPCFAFLPPIICLLRRRTIGSDLV